MTYPENPDPLTQKAPMHQEAALEVHRKNLSAYGRTTIKPNKTYEIIVSTVTSPLTLYDKRGNAHVMHDGFTISHHTTSRTLFGNILADIRAVVGRKYSKDKKLWWVPIESRPELDIFMQKYSLDIIPTPESIESTPNQSPVTPTDENFNVGDTVIVHWKLSDEVNYKAEGVIEEINSIGYKMRLNEDGLPDGSLFSKGNTISIPKKGAPGYYSYNYIELKQSKSTIKTSSARLSVFNVGDIVTAHWNIGTPTKYYEHDVRITEIEDDYIQFELYNILGSFVLDDHQYNEGDGAGFKFKYPFSYPKHYLTVRTSSSVEDPALIFNVGDIVTATWGDDIDHTFHVSGQGIIVVSENDHWEVKLTSDVTDGTNTWHEGKIIKYYKDIPFTGYKNLIHIEEPDEPPLEITLSQSEIDTANIIHSNIYNNIMSSLLSGMSITSKKIKLFQPGDIVIAKFSLSGGEKFSIKGKVLQNDRISTNNTPYYSVELLEDSEPYHKGYEASIRREDHPEYDEDNRLVAFSPEIVKAPIITKTQKRSRNIDSKIEFLENSYINQAKADGKKQVSINNVSKMIKQILKIAFSGTKFSVRTSKYSGGHSINVTWDFGPTTKDVDQLIRKYHDKSFDGMTDSTTYLKTPWNNDSVSTQRNIPNDFWLLTAVEIAAKHHKIIEPTNDAVRNTYIGSEHLIDLVNEEINKRTY